MNSKKVTTVFLLTAFSVVILGLASCQKKEIEPQQPATTPILKAAPLPKRPNVTMKVYFITGNTVTCDISVSVPKGGAPVREWGILYSSGPAPMFNHPWSYQQVVWGNSSGNFTKVLGNLTNNTVYYFRAYAFNSFDTLNGLSYSAFERWSTTIPTTSICNGLITDARDGQTYKVVQIGNQCWMAENLNYGKKINTPEIPANNEIAEKYCYNNLESNCDVYGGLYEWNELMEYASEGSNTNPSNIQGLCPAGWHIPGMGELTQMLQFLGNGDRNLGGRMKETGLAHWLKPNSDATNASGFTALGSGRVELETGTFANLKSYTQFWSSTIQIDPDLTPDQRAYYLGGLSYSALLGTINLGGVRTAFNAIPVRCVKDVNVAP